MKVLEVKRDWEATGPCVNFRKGGGGLCLIVVVVVVVVVVVIGA